MIRFTSCGSSSFAFSRVYFEAFPAVCAFSRAWSGESGRLAQERSSLLSWLFDGGGCGADLQSFVPRPNRLLPFESIHRGNTAEAAASIATVLGGEIAAPALHDALGRRAVMRATRIARRQLSCAFLVATMASAYAQPPGAPLVPDDRVISAGQWAVVAVEWNGKHVDPELLSMLKVVFRADGTWAVLFKGIPAAEGRSTNHQDRSPKTFEMETLGSEGIKPKHYKGIYRVDGDTRLLCIVPDEEPRPAEFSAPSLSGRMLVTLKRRMTP